MLAGVEDDGEILRALAVVVERAGARPALRIVLGEGRNRHVRRMLAALGLRVRGLRRIRIGALTEADLRGRPLRELSPAELSRLVPT